MKTVIVYVLGMISGIVVLSQIILSKNNFVSAIVSSVIIVILLGFVSYKIQHTSNNKKIKERKHF